jgi:hypothetical protein
MNITYTLDPLTELNVVVALRLNISGLLKQRRHAFSTLGVSAAARWTPMVLEAVKTLRDFRTCRVR